MNTKKLLIFISALCFVLSCEDQHVINDPSLRISPCKEVCDKLLDLGCNEWYHAMCNLGKAETFFCEQEIADPKCVLRARDLPSIKACGVECRGQ